MRWPGLNTPRRRRLLSALAVIGLGQAAAMLAMALGVGQLFDLLLSTARTHASPRLWVGVSAALMALAALRGTERVVAERLGQDYVHALRDRLVRRLVETPPRELISRSHGVVLLRLTGDLSAVRQWVSLGLARLLVGGAMGLGALIALVWVDPALAFAALVPIASGTALAYVLGRPMEEAVRDARRARGRLAGQVADLVRGLATIQACGRVRSERRRVADRSRDLAQRMIRRATVTGSLRAVTELTAGFTTLAALGIGGWQVMAGVVSPGTVVGVMAIVGFLTTPLRDLARVHEYWRAMRVARAKIEGFLATAPALRAPRAQGRGSPPLSGSIQLESIHSGPLRGLDADIAAGTRVLVTGPNGSGKSTLLHLVARLCDPDRGVVRIDGLDVRRIPLRRLRRTVAIVSHELPLVRGSLRRNLVYANPGVRPETLAAVCRLCGLEPVIAKLPQGLDTRIGPDTRWLSNGEAQRVFLARALMCEPRILLLDEVESFLDAGARSALARVLDRFPGTVLMVTHRAGYRSWAHRVLDVEKGRLMEDVGPEGPVAAFPRAAP
ncbi:MAG TPA: ABC transporter ATP-binding protein [Chromatiales bacterium]|nr:ABC transporter ATP-binding protein [Chromatiales bacterium]